MTKSLFPLLAVALCFFTACASNPATPTVPPPTFTPAPAMPEPSLPPVILEPSATPTPLIVTPVSLTDTPTALTVYIFLIALEDKGQSGKAIGCDDSAVPVQVTIPQTSGVLRVALETLLSIKEPYYGQSGLYNALHQSDLQLQDVTIESGRAVIHLTGTLMIGGVCDNPRIKAQLEETALQFSTVNTVSIFVNDVPLEDLLSQEG